MKKRIVSWITALAVGIMQLMPSAAIIAYAATLEASVSLSEATGMPGDTVTLDLTLKDNPGLNSLAIYFEYDTNALECVGIDEKELLGSQIVLGVNVVYSNSDISKSPVKMLWIPADTVNSEGLLASIDFKIKDNASSKDYEIKLTPNKGENYQVDSSKDPFKDPDYFIDVNLNLKSGKITVEGNKPVNPTRPEPPEISNETATGFDVTVPEGNEYTYSTDEITDFADCNWYTTKNVTGLYPNTKYYVYQRIAENQQYLPSLPSDAAIAETKKLNVTDVIESVSIGDNGTVGTKLTPKITYKSGYDASYAGDISSYAWVGTASTDSKVLSASSYVVTSEDAAQKKQIFVRLAFDNCNGIIDSNYVVAGKIPPASPEKPIIKDITYSGFTLAAMTGYEYIISDTNSIDGKSWTDLNNDVVVDGLSPNDVRYVFVRIKETETHNASDIASTVVRIAACEHGDTEELIEEPTCTELGKITVVCKVCGEIISSTDIPALGHSFGSGEVRVEGDCTNGGLIVYTCERCGIEREKITAPLGHVQGEWKIITEATCEDDGRKVIECVKCHNVIAEEIISSTGHNWGAWYKVTDTRYERTCSNCGESDFVDVAEPIEHDEHIFTDEVSIVPATCTSKGSRTLQCSVDGCDVTITETISKTAHTHGEEDIVPASCTVDGKKIVYCADCETIISETLIFATGHSFTNYTDTATCTMPGEKTAFCDNGCGTEDFEPTPAKGHIYGDWISKGEEGHYQKCSVCGSESEVVKHNFDSGRVTKPATATEKGERTFTCTDCQYTKIEEINPVPEHEHDFNTTWSFDQTGHWHECSSCTEISDFASHNMESEITVSPTATSTGLVTYYCTVCNYSYTKVISSGYESPTPPNSNGSVVPSDTVTASNEPYIQNRSKTSGWSKITAVLRRTAEENTVNIAMNGTTKLPKKVLEAIQNKDITLVLDMGNGLMWTINGLNVTNPKAVDMGAAIKVLDNNAVVGGNDMAGKQYYLSLSHDGVFGFTGTLSVFVGNGYNGSTARLYYCRSKNDFDFITQNTVSGGYVDFGFTHASDYIIVLDNDDYIGEDVSAGAGITYADSLINVSMPINGGLTIAVLPRKLKISNKKRRYRILRKRRLDDLVFVY